MRIVSLYDAATGKVAFSTSVQLPLEIDPITATEAQWAAAIADLVGAAGMPCVVGHAAPGQRVVDGVLVDVVDPPPTLEQLRSAKLAEINSAFTAASTALTAGYPAAERQTWPAQEIEALAWGADPSSPTPYLDGIAAVRGITALDMREKTLESVNAFRAAAQWLVGTRQALRDAIQNPDATTAQIAAIAWPASPSQE